MDSPRIQLRPPPTPKLGPLPYPGWRPPIVVHVSLLNGRSVELKADCNVEAIKAKAQNALGQGFLKLILPDGRVLQDAMLQKVDGIQLTDGLQLTALVLRAEIAATKNAFALWCQGGDGVAAWGSPKKGGRCPFSRQDLQKVRQVEASEGTFTALLQDGTARIWGGDVSWITKAKLWPDRTDLSPDVFPCTHHMKNVTQLLSSRWLFVANMLDGSCTCWSERKLQDGETARLKVFCTKLRNVQQVQTTEDGSVAALLENGSVSILDTKFQCPAALRKKLSEAHMVSQIKSNTGAWGDPLTGGGQGPLFLLVPKAKVINVEATDRAFAALFADGSVLSWGDRDFGGDSSKVQHLRGVQQIRANGCAFAAVLSDESVATWGAPQFGGDSSHVQGQLQNVQSISATHYAFAALRSPDGSVACWGDPAFGGASEAYLTDVQRISGTTGAFAAVTSDGKLFTWGSSLFGAKCQAVEEWLPLLG